MIISLLTSILLTILVLIDFVKECECVYPTEEKYIAPRRVRVLYLQIFTAK